MSDSPLHAWGSASGRDSWTHIEGADALRLELANRGGEHVLHILRQWVGDQASRLEWEYGWVTSVEERDCDWEVVVPGLTGDERVLSLLVPEPAVVTLDLRLAVEAVYRDGSAVMLFVPPDADHPVGESYDGVLVGLVPERVENFGQSIPFVSGGQCYGLLPQWWPERATLPPIPARA